MHRYLRSYRLYAFVLTALSLILTLPQSSTASEFRAKDNLTVNSNEVVRDDLYMFGNDVEVRGDVEGDFVAFAYIFSSYGEIMGSANVFAYSIDMTGHVGGTVRTFAYNTRVNCPIEGNFVGMSGELRVGDKAVISRDLDFVAERLTFDGIVRGNLKGEGDDIKIAGTVFGDVDISAKKLVIVAPAVIKGDLHYTSLNEAIIEDGVVIEGKTDWKKQKVKENITERNYLGPFVFGLDLFLFIMAFVTGLLLVLLFKDHAVEASNQVYRKFWHTVAIGFLTFIILTGGALVAAVLIIGIPISIMMIMTGLILFYIGKVYTAVPLGKWVIESLFKNAHPGIVWQLLLGLFILTLLFQIPFLGYIIYVLAFIIGAGAAVAAAMEIYKGLRRTPQ